MTIKIGWQKYRIILVPKISVDEGKNELYGHQLGSAGLLKVSKQYGKRRAQACMIHELLHAIDEQYVAELKEEQIESIANGITAAIFDNKEEAKNLINWIAK